MGLFDKKKKEKIPEVGGSGPAPSAYRQGPPSVAPSNASMYSQNPPPSYRTAPAYVPPSQGGGGYQNQSHFNRPPPPQQHNSYGQQPEHPPVEPAGGKAKGSWFGRGKDKEQEQRSELFAGAPPPGQGHPGFDARGPQQQGGGYNPYGEQGGQQEQQFENEEDEEVEGIKQQMRFVKQESLASTRNAVRIAREAEETARATLDKLGEQSDRIANTERHLDLAKAHNERAVDETKELEALNRSIFRPTFTFNKQAKRDREERRLLDRHNAEKAEREAVRREQYESRQRIDQTFNKMDRDAENTAQGRAKARARGAERSRYQFEATASDDEVEDEIDTNLDELSGVAGRLKMLGVTMGQEVDSQNKKLGKISGKVDVLDNNVVKSTQRLARVK
ncbi:Protein transport protein S9 plasma membrane t-SNARE [Rhodotorula kratochvilovae]